MATRLVNKQGNGKSKGIKPISAVETVETIVNPYKYIKHLSVYIILHDREQVLEEFL